MNDSLRLFLPSASDLVSLGVTIGVATGFLGLGRLIDRGRVSPALMLVSGWASVVLAAVVFGAVVAWPLKWALYPLLVVGLGAFLWGIRSRPDEGRVTARAAVVLLPLLLVIAAASASQWDEFAHWLINQRYLVEVGTFPRLGLPTNVTMFAAYPYGLPLVGFLVSALVGQLVENAGAMFNTILIMVLGAVLIEAFQKGSAAPERPASWGAVALGFFAATLLNPTFVPKLVFTSYADWSTAIVLGVAVFTAWRVIETSELGNAISSRALALHLGLSLALLVSLKQPNVILAVLVLLGVAVAVLCPPRASAAAMLRLVPWIVGPPLVAYFVWRYHVLQHMPGREFRFLPIVDWLWSDMGAIFGRMLLIASKKGGYFGLMLAATGVAAYGLYGTLRGSNVVPPPLMRLSALLAVLFLGYNAFLYIAYVGAFGAGEGNNAASYWRYNTQLGGAALVFAAVSAGTLYRRVGGPERLPRVAVTGLLVAVVVVSLAFAPKLRFDLNQVTRYVRSVGVDLGGMLRPGSVVVVVDPGDNGKRALLLRYEARDMRVERLDGSRFVSAVKLQEALASYADRPATFLWVHEPKPVIVQTLAIELAPGSSYLLARIDGGWRPIRSWPYPGYASPADEDD